MKKIFLFSALVSLTIFIACSKQEMEVEVVPAQDEETLALDTKEQTERQRFNTTISTGSADFTIKNEGNQLFENDILALSNNSKNAVSYHWDFGNGDTSTEANPSYKYRIHGHFTVTLTTTDASGATHQASQDVVVLCIFGGGPHDQ